METIVIDGRVMTSREALHDWFTACLSLPEHYGRNLDALYDCLTERDTPTRLELCHIPELEAALGQYAYALLKTLEDAARNNPSLEVVRSGLSRGE